ncbi:MAG: helix-turn-helix domain-containing protein [Betaproteobacteria bacterium]
MPNLNWNPASRPSALLRQSGLPGQVRTLQIANCRALKHLGSPIATTNDPKGHVLRQLRLQLGVDPSLLATQACISLSQLYELENGDISRFYSDSLRRQAGRRVAHLLGADWDQMAQENLTKTSSTPNAFDLQRPVGLPIHTDPISAHNKGNMAHAQSELLRPSSWAINKLLTMDASNDARTTSMGLTPHENDFMPANSTKLQPQTRNDSTTPKSSVWLTLLTLMLVVATGATGGYIFAEYSPYSLYWPW